MTEQDLIDAGWLPVGEFGDLPAMTSKAFFAEHRLFIINEDDLPCLIIDDDVVQPIGGDLIDGCADPNTDELFHGTPIFCEPDNYDSFEWLSCFYFYVDTKIEVPERNRHEYYFIYDL